jgi:hypothetical protein
MTIVVDISDEKTGLLGEQKMVDTGSFQQLAEMETLENWTDIVPGVKQKAQQLVEQVGDATPEFPILRVEEGWSNNGRLWNAECLDVIAEQVNNLEPVAHLGHIKEEDFGTAFPEPQTIWLGAITRTEPSRQKDRIGQMVRTFYVKGYNLPDAKVRNYIKTRTVKGISWLCHGSVTRVPGKGVAVDPKTIKLRAIDWARKLSEGMPTTEIVALVGEQEGATVGEKNLAQVTPEEFKKENPNGHALLVSEAVAEKDQQLAEMKTKVDEGEKAKSALLAACEALGIDDPEQLIDSIKDLTKRIGDKAKVTTEAALDKLLASKVTDEGQRAVIKRLLPLPEMEAKIADAKEEDVDKLLGEMIDTSFNNDDVIKGLIGEQSPVSVRRREALGNKSGGEKDSKYGKRDRVTMS